MAFLDVGLVSYVFGFDARTDAARFFVAIAVGEGRTPIATGLLDSKAPYGYDVFVNYDDAPLPPDVEVALVRTWLRYRLETRYPGSTHED